MRKFIISSEKFTGEIEVIYNDDGDLDKLDFMRSTANHDQRKLIKQSLAIVVEELVQRLKTLPIVIMETDFVCTFDMFYEAYKRKENPARAKKKWDLLSKADQLKAYLTIAAYDKHLKRENWRHKAGPDTYLFNRMFESDWKSL